MAQFTYKARNRSGEVVQGVLDVGDRSAALAQIERLGLYPVFVEAAKGAAKVERARAVAAKGGARPAAAAATGAAAAAARGTAWMPRGLREMWGHQRRPKMQEMATFTQQLANLLRSGMPLTVALNSMTHLESKGIPSEVSRGLKQDVMEGRSLSDAMMKQPRIFSDLYVNMVRAGEQSGALEEVLRRMAEHFERFAEVQSKFVSALTYPALVLGVGVVIIVFFMTFMLPKFLSIFDGMKVPLPASTRALVAVSQAFERYWWLMALVALVAGVVFMRFRASPRGRRALDHWKLRAPVVGKVFQLNLFGQFARTLSTLLHNGVPVLTALKITEQVVPNVIIKEAIARTREDVTDGKTIAQPLARSRIFPQLMLDLLKIGEETGDVPGALKNVADTYENELNIALRVMTNLIEPIMIIFMAIGVGGLLLSVLSAMFAVTSSINNAF